MLRIIMRIYIERFIKSYCSFQQEAKAPIAIPLDFLATRLSLSNGDGITY